MRESTRLWKKRMVLLLAITLLAGEISSVSMVSAVASGTEEEAAGSSTESSVETLPVPEEYYTLGGEDTAAPKTETENKGDDIGADTAASEETIPVLSPTTPENQAKAEAENGTQASQQNQQQQQNPAPQDGFVMASEDVGADTNVDDIGGDAAGEEGDNGVGGNTVSANEILPDTPCILETTTNGEYETKYFSYSVPEDGYYAFVVETDVSAGFDCETTLNGEGYAKGQLQDTLPYVDYYTMGETYQIAISGFFYVGTTYKLTLKRVDTVLEITDGKASGTVSDMAVIPLNYDTDGQVYLTHGADSNTTYTYRLISAGASKCFAGLSAESWCSTSVFCGKSRENFWLITKETETMEQINTEISFIPLVEFDASVSQQTVKVYTGEKSGDSTVKRIFVSYKPGETGNYYFRSEFSGGNVTIGEIQRDANNNITGLNYLQGFYSSWGSSAKVTLESGKEYYYEAYKYEYPWSEPIPDEVTLSVQKKDPSVVPLATETTLDITGGGQLVTFESEKGKFYRMSLKSSDADDKYVFAQTVNGEGACTQFVNYISYASEHATILYACDGSVGMFVEKDTTNGWTGKVTVCVEEYVPASLKLGQPVSNSKVLQSMEPHVVSFIPDKTGTYSIWGIDYSERGYNQDVFLIDENGWLSTVSDVNGNNGVFCYDYSDRQYDLTAGETYYICQYEHGQTGVDEYLVCIDEAKNYEYDFSKGDKADFDIELYKSAKVDLTIQENGFYEIITEGDADNYQITDGNGERFTVYNGQPKTFYMDSDGEYTLQVSREFKKGDTSDKMKLTIQKAASPEEVPVYNTNTELEAGEGAAVSLRESADFQWLVLKAPSDGYYRVKTVYPPVDEDEDFYGSVYIQAYRITDGQMEWLNSEQYNAYKQKLAEGEEIYLKVTTWSEGAEASVKALKYQNVTVKDGETVTVNDVDGYVALNTSVSENGIYEVSLTKSDTETWAYYESDYTEEEFTDSVKLTTYMKAGDNEAVIQCTDNELKISVAKKESVELAKTIDLSYDTDSLWIKYVPEKSGEQVVGFKNTNESLETNGISVYKLSEDADSISSVWGTTRYGEFIRYKQCSFTAGETYFFKITFNYWGEREEEISPLTVFVQDVVSVSAGLDENAEVTTDKFAQVNIVNEEGSGYEKGWYQVSITNNDGDVDVSLNGGSSNVTSQVIKPDSDAVFLKTQKGSLSLFLTKQDGESAEDTFNVTVTPCKENSLKTFAVGESVAKTAESNLEFYTFKVLEDGEYRLTSKGITYVYYKNDAGTYKRWSRNSSKTFVADSEILLCVPNKKGTNYEISLSQISTRALYDADQYTAFLASGGTITVKNYEDFTEAEKILLEEEEGDTFSYIGGQNYIIRDVSGFKNKNDIWYPEELIKDQCESSRDTYDEYLSWVDSYIKHGTSNQKVFLGFYKTNGQKAADTDKLENPYYLLAKFAPRYVWVQDITITGVNALKVGQSATLTANLDTRNQYTPTDASVTWSSSDSSVVSVDQNGKITAKKAGSAVITVKSNDQLGVSNSLQVTVSQDVVYVEKVTITGKDKVYVGDEIQLQATLDTNGKGKPSRDGVTWSTSDAKVATVDANGKVTGISAGTITITAASKDGKAKATYTITVENVVEKKIKLNESKITMKKGTKYKWLEVTFNPKNTTDKTLKWKSSDKKVATVNSKGVITAKGVGKATITVTSANGKKDTVKVTVTKSSIKVKKLSLEKKLTMKLGDKENLKPEFEPVNATNQKLEWKSSNEKVATVNSKGQVTAVGEGKAKITCTAKDGSKKKATCTITVKGFGKLKISKVTNESKGAATITWNTLEDVDGYEVYMATGKKGTYNKIATVDSNKTSFIKKKLKKGTKYYFKVRAYAKVNGKKVYGDYSSAKSVKIKK